MHIKNPRVGLVNIGSEEEKGNRGCYRSKQAFERNTDKLYWIY